MENTANQNRGKPLYIWWYYTQTSHQAPWACPLDSVGHAILYGMVKGECVYQENKTDKWDIPWYAAQKCCITSVYTYIYKGRNDQ